MIDRNHPALEELASRSHPECWQGDHYEHSCHEPSGRSCVECGAPAGTPWGPYFCPECDVVRLDRIEANLLALGANEAAS